MSGALRAKNRAVMRGKPGSHSDRGWRRHIWRHGSVEPEGWGDYRWGLLFKAEVEHAERLELKV